MKTIFISCLTATTLLLASCKEEHHEGDGHDHSAEKHSTGDGHKHE